MPDEHNANEIAEAKNIPSVNRRRFVKALGGAGGAAITGAMFASSATAKASLPSTVQATEPITGDELGEVIQSVTTDTNVVNVMGDTWAAEVQRAGIVKQTQTVSADTDSRSSLSDDQKRVTQYKVASSGKDTTVKAARHELKNENKLTAVAFAIGDEQLLVYRNFKRLQNGRKTKVALYDVMENDEEAYPKISAVERSINGAKPKQVSEVQQEKEISQSSDCQDPCGGCHPAPEPGNDDYGYRTTASCRGVIDMGCVGQNCSTCGFICLGGPGVCAACIVVMCSFWSFVNCCPDNPEEHCVKCLDAVGDICDEF